MRVRDDATRAAGWNILAGQCEPVKALDEIELQHAFSVDGVSTVTIRFVLQFAKKANLKVR